MERNLKDAGLTQEVFAEKAGVALTVIRKIEQGKRGLQLEKVNQSAGRTFTTMIAEPIQLTTFLPKIR